MNDDDLILVPRGLLMQCLEIIEEAQKHCSASAAFIEDMTLAIGQLERSLSDETKQPDLF